MYSMMMIRTLAIGFSTLVVFSSFYSTTGESLYHTFWVTPSTEQGCGDRTPCDTIDGYYNQNGSIFSTSNATWIFLEGVHSRKLSANLTVEAENVALKGIPDKHVTLQIQKIVFEEYRNVTMANLHIQFCNMPMSTTEVFGLVIQNVHFSNTWNCKEPSLLNLKISVSGSVLIVNSNFENVNLEINAFDRFDDKTGERDNLAICIQNVHFFYSNITTWIGNSKETCINCIRYMTFDLSSCVLSGTAFDIHNQENTYYNISIRNSTYSYGDFGLNLQMYSIDPGNAEQFPTFEVSFENCHFEGEAHQNSGFLVVIKGLGWSTSRKEHVPLIMFTNTTFNGTAVVLQNFEVAGINFSVNLDQTDPFVVFSKCTFSRFKYVPSFQNYIELINGYLNEGYVLTLKNLWIPVLLSNCKITDNAAGAIDINNSKLRIQGLNIVQNNHILNDSVRAEGILRFTGYFKLLLENNSNLVVKDNTGRQYGGLYFPPFQMQYGKYHPSSMEFQQCLQEKACTGGCFFQLVDENGCLMKEKLIPLFTGKLSIEGNRGQDSKVSSQLYNGHLYNCYLDTEAGPIVANKNVTKQIIHVPSWDSNTISSPPYLCIYNERDKFNQSRWQCNHNTTIVTNENLTLCAMIVKDPSVQMNGTLSKPFAPSSNLIEIDNNCFYQKNFNRNLLQTKMQEYLFRISIILDCHKSLEIIYPLKDYFFFHQVNVLRCPVGFKKDTVTMKCKCPSFLLEKGFECFAEGNVFIRQLSNGIVKKWIGWKNNELVIATHCPQFLCNNRLHVSGIYLNSTDQNVDLQCNSYNKRIGFLCSECPPGYSSVLGDFKCADCRGGAWYLLVILCYAMFGLLIIVILFLFNMTIVQGVINGICLYVNVVYIYYDDFLQDTDRNPLYSVISIFNLALGLEICFYDGMNELAKALLQFVFPFYLFILVILIIIGAHKFNLRIFKVEFIAKRAVPVLATLMVLTYTNLIGVTIHAFRHSKVYTITEDNIKREIRWLYQPELHYMQDQHLILAVLTIALSFFYLIPLTVVTLFGDLLRRNCIRSLWFSHFLDVFHGAYRWPLGFWLGVTLLIRLLMIVVRCTADFEKFNTILNTVFCVFFILQWAIVKPFHIRFTATTNSLSLPTKNNWRTQVSSLLKSLVNPTYSNGLFLVNIIYFSANNFSKDIFTYTLASYISLSAAMIQICLIFVYHGWLYFPIPTSVKVMWKRFKAKLRKVKAKQLNVEAEEAISLSTSTHPTELFPFNSIHHLVAGTPSEGNESDSGDEEISDDGEVEHVQVNGLVEPLLVKESNI